MEIEVKWCAVCRCGKTQLARLYRGRHAVQSVIGHVYVTLSTAASTAGSSTGCHTTSQCVCACQSISAYVSCVCQYVCTYCLMSVCLAANIIISCEVKRELMTTSC